MELTKIVEDTTETKDGKEKQDNKDSKKDTDKVSIEGKVEFHEAGVAIGGETDPEGYVINHKKYKRVYLRLNGSLTDKNIKLFKGTIVIVKGAMSEITAGGVGNLKREPLK